MRSADELRPSLQCHSSPAGPRLPEALEGADRDVAGAEIVRAWWLTREGARMGAFRAPRRLLTRAELDGRRSRDRVHALALPILEEFGARVAQLQQVIALFDADGWMLSIAGHPRTAEWVAEIDFHPGANWREEPADDGTPGAASSERLVNLRRAGAVIAVWTTWVCSAASIRDPRSGDLLGLAAIAGPWMTDAQARLVARAVSHAVEERLSSAQLVRDQVVEYAFRTASDAGDGMFAIARDGRVLVANDAARRRLAFEGLDVPLPVRGRVEALLGKPTASSGGDLDVDWPGRPAHVRLLASPVRYEQGAVGAIVRVLAARTARARRPTRGAAAPAPASLARYRFTDVLGESRSISRVVAFARMASRNDLPVVLVGESGTGKELFAQAIHAESGRGGGPFIAVNCGCIPATLLEAELFGYEPGTFTGAREDGNAGKFEEACGGTLFLDEVNELTPQAQTALLRVLQEREVVRLGGSSPRRVDIRIVAASSRHLSEEIKAGRFRSDLYFRLNVLSVDVPPLRERRHDVELLARSFLASAEVLVARSGLAFSEDALLALSAYRWPGNVRELRNVVLRVAATAREATIGLMDLPEEVRAAARVPAPSCFDASPAGPGRACDGDVGREALLRALDAAAWNVARTAQMLRISRMTLYRWLHKHGIER